MSVSEVASKDWIIVLPAFRIAPLKVESLKIVCNEAVTQSAIRVLLAKSGNACHVRRYILPWTSKEGSVSHLISVSDGMVEIAYEIWMDILMNRRKINQIHVIAPQNGAIFAIKWLSFFSRHADNLGDYTMEEFDIKWNLYPWKMDLWFILCFGP